MAFGRGRTSGDVTSEEPRTAPQAAQAPPAAEGGPLTAFIDQGSSFEGKLSFKDTVRIDGNFSGEITSENTLIVGEPGEVQADIRSKTVVVSGTVMGNVTASQKLVIHKTGCLEGNVETASLVVEEGAQLNGQLKMNSGASAGTAPKSKAKSED